MDDILVNMQILKLGFDMKEYLLVMGFIVLICGHNSNLVSSGNNSSSKQWWLRATSFFAIKRFYCEFIFKGDCWVWSD